jgi:hypothetical protein
VRPLQSALGSHPADIADSVLGGAKQFGKEAETIVPEAAEILKKTFGIEVKELEVRSRL